MKNIDQEIDLFLSREYLNASLLPSQTLFEFEYSEGNNRFLSRSIANILSTKVYVSLKGSTYKDLQTNMSYGGYHSTFMGDSFLASAIKELRRYCVQKGIIAQLIRFNPLEDSTIKWKKHLDFFSLDRKTVNVDLKLTKEMRWRSYSSSTRNTLRKTTPEFRFEILDKVSEFEDLYKKTLLRNFASANYFYTTDYFEFLQKSRNAIFAAVYIGSEMISSAIFIITNLRAYYHLSANSINGLKLNGNYVLIESMINYLQTEFPNIEVLHLGGGRTNALDDNLLNFKRKFSCTFADYYIGGMIFNNSLYNELVQESVKKHPELGQKKYFLKYRFDVK